MDFAEVKELDQIIVPYQSFHPGKVIHNMNEDDLVAMCQSTGQVIRMSPKPSAY